MFGIMLPDSFSTTKRSAYAPMKTNNYKRAVAPAAFLGLSIIFCACRPSVREVANVVSKVPPGSSRDELRKELLDAYSKRFPNWKQSYALTDPPLPITERLIDANLALYAGCKKRRSYAVIRPPDLFQKPLAYFDFIGLVAESSEGNGSLSLYYDSKTNFVGFFAQSTEKRK